VTRLKGLTAAVRVRPEALGGVRLKPVEVAILDSGIDASHPALRGRIVAAFRVEGGRRKPAVRPARRKNNDDYGHGTAVASIIARIAPNARLVDIRVLGPDNQGSGAALIEGLRFAVERGSRLINMSLAATGEFAADLRALCETAYYRNQILVAAKRNMPLVDNGFPAEFSSCIGVDNRAFPTPFVFRFMPGQVIEYAAQGTEIAVAAPGGGYTTSTGTSFATPTITGICARVLGAYPDMRPFEVKSLLKLFAR
jgi:subtilisin family serine protease